MSLTSYRTAPPREDRLGVRRVCGEKRALGGDWAWRRPTLPPLERQYHGRGGFSRPSSGWDRVLGPSLWPPGPKGVMWGGEVSVACWGLTLHAGGGAVPMAGTGELS